MRFFAQPFFEPSNDALRFLPEGPRVLRNHPSANGKLGWVSIQHATASRHGSLNLLNLATGHNEQIDLEGRPGFFAETATPGVVLVGMERRLVLIDLVTGRLVETVAELEAPEETIINEGLAVDGGVLFGTKHLGFSQPLAGLYFFRSRGRRMHRVIGAQVCSNGKFLCRAGDGYVLVDIDSQPKTITRYRLDAGLVNVLEQALVVPRESLVGFPDGLRPVPGGEAVVVAIYNPAMAQDGLAQEISIADGVIRNEWIMPGSPRVTCPEFVEHEGRVKVVFTTAVEGMDEATRRIAKHAGAMYMAETPYQALPSAPPLVVLD